MSLALFSLISLVAVGSVILLPALVVQLALGYWFRPAERIPLDEVWAQRFDEHVLALSGSSGSLNRPQGSFDE